MDYDENDFQSQNFQIVGDENKFPPSLRSFALPKFDLDDHLQVHLRFDSLIDTDVLLGIQGQNNNWIEDFSSGTSAIEFSSSAVDNCSISRHNNVWSEATSSESVEMLLKSVGEDEMNDKKTITMESDAQNLPSCMIHHMDPVSRQVGDDTSLMGDIIQDDPSKPPDKFQRKLLGQDKDASGVHQLQVQGMSQIFNNEISGAELDTSSLGDKIQSDGKNVAGQGTTDENVTLQLDDTNKTCPIISETLCNMVNNDETLDMEFMKASDGRGWDSSEVGRVSPHSMSCSTQGQVMEKHTVLNMSERSDLLSDDAQKERSQMLQHAKGNEQFLDGHATDACLCSKESSLLENARDSLVLTSEGYNMTDFSGNPDGLLEAIAYQGNNFNNDNRVGNKSLRQANEMSALENERERFVQTDYANISKESIPNHTTDHNDTGIENTSEMAVDANSSIHINSDTQLEETENEISLEINHSNLGSRTLESAFEEKDGEAEIVEDVEESGSKLIASENVILGESSLPAALNNAEIKISSSVPGKLHKAAVPSDVHPSSLEVSAGDEDVGPSTCTDTTNSKNDDNVVIGKAEAAGSAGQNSYNVGDNSVSPAKKLVHDGSVADLPSTGVGLPPLKKYSNNDESHPGSSLVGDAAREQKEVSSPKLLEFDSIGSDVKEVKLTGPSYVSVLKCNSYVLLPTEPVIISDPVATECSSPRGLTQDVPVGVKVPVLDETIKCHQSQHTSAAAVVPQQKEGATSSPFSLEFGESNEKEAKVFYSSLMKSDGHVDDRPLVDNGGSSPLINTTRPQTVLVEQPSSFVENPVASQCELQSLADKPVIHDEVIVVEGNLVIHDSSVKGRVYPEASSHEDKETNFGVSADPVNSGTNTSTTLSRSNAEAHSLAVETGKKSLPKASCGSPTIISCSGNSQDESEGGSTDKVKYTTLGSKESTTSEDDRSFTFEVGRIEELSEKDAGNRWKPFPIVQSSEVCHLETEGKNHGVITKTASEDKSSRAARSSNEKVTTQKGKTAKGTSTLKKSTDSAGKSSTTSSAPVETISSGMQLVEIKPSTYSESNLMKTSASTIVQSSSLPDLNSSSATTLFHQPFTDIQQVQLRAQIFVYGSLIQSIPPDEACMQSAIGETDVGRISWESIWRKSVERYQNQKSPVNSETPLHSHSVVRAPEQLTKSGSLQSKAVSTSASKSVGKVISPAILNSTPPLSSPLWSVSTHDGLNSSLPRDAQLDFNLAFSPLHSYPSSQTRQFTSNSTSWLPQNPRPGPWAMSTQSPALNAATQYSTVPVVETVQVTPVRDSSMPRPASVQLGSPGTLLHTPSPASVPPASVLHLETQGKTGILGNNNASSTQKSRKRKKAAATEDFAETIPVSQPPTEPASASALIKTPSTSTGFLLSTNVASKVASEPIVSVSTHIPHTQYQIIGSGNTEHIFSEETGKKIEQAKLQAEDAAAVAASVISHSQGIWNQLVAQMNSGLVTEVEEKLASAAVAAAAAASVARAAAAAAKVASEAALQAKMMADEALDSAKTGSLIQSSETVFDAGKNFVRLTPGSILKGKDKIHGPSSIISVAHEATRRRVEAASAATKRAENLDAIMKAAELAAEAVSQVGAIIAMGDPLPFKLSDLVEAGPEGSWKAYRISSDKLNKANTLLGEEDKNLDHLVHHCDQTPSTNKEIHKTPLEGGTFQDDHSIKSSDECRGSGSGVGNLSTLPNESHERDHSLSNLKENAIQKGSIVEVISDEDGLRGGWFSARVLDVKENTVHVYYNNLLSDDGSDQLKEWVSLDSECNGSPRIRIAHRMLGTKYDGTRKRRREAVGSYVWEVGDRVDAWMRDGWWEGIVTEKNQLDETKLTVKFPAGGDSSLVRAWDLRPSLTWKDGQWIEWCRAREDMHLPYEGDTPQEKRQKLGRPEAKLYAEVDSRGIGKLSKKIPPEDSGKEQLVQLNLAAKDKNFSVGKNASMANISDALKMKRTGLQKEGSRVVFGVPKPGKKRKFMEVSKHYVSDKSVASQGNTSLKFAKYLMPQTTRPWRNTSKVDSKDTSKVDSKGKQAGDIKSLGVKPVKSQASQTRSTTNKDNLSVPTVSASYGEKNGHESSSNMRAGFTDEDNLEKNSLEVASFSRSLGTKESLVPVYPVQSLSTAHAAKKKSSSAIEAELGVKGKLTPALDKSTRSERKPSENSGKAIPDAIEPRRSNRKIQPTSRLLEGLQSSLIISKIPSFSHDKGSKVLHRSSSSRGNARGS